MSRSPMTADPFRSLDGASEELDLLRRRSVLPVFVEDGRAEALAEDLADVASIETATRGLDGGAGRLFALAPNNAIGVGEGTRVELLGDADLAALGPAVRSLARVEGAGVGDEVASPWLAGTTVVSKAPEVLGRAACQHARGETLDHLRAPDLAGATSYMGSKRELASFLVEATFAETEGREDTVVLDLMCGSGAASAAFANFWPTYASDAQQFSVLLARSQGGGMSSARARVVVEATVRDAGAHVETLLARLGDFVSRETELLHAGDHGASVTSLRSFFSSYPRYGMAPVGGWDPTALVDRARAGDKGVPHMLFCAYFANVYFGVRQCVEIDSLRAVIDGLGEPERSWALAALIASVASVATTYGGHFAQPRIADADQITERNIGGLIEKRSASVVHEFSARLLNLAAESERTPFAVRGLKGPWQDALRPLSPEVGPRPTVVYLDPPYRREEYSRYYHVLETLVRYDYPGIQDKGLAPPKGNQRFASEFFTRSVGRREALLQNVIESVLGTGASCAWSYSDSADGSIQSVVRRVVEATGATVRSYATLHRHRAHGGHKDRRVIEYLIWFRPRSRGTG